MLNSFFASNELLIGVFCPGRNANVSVRFNPALTSTFVRPLDPLITELKVLKKAIGWKVKAKEEECDLGMEVTFKGIEHALTKESTNTSRLKYTWEVIKESGLHSYDIADNPNYADVMRFLNDHNKQRAARIEGPDGGRQKEGRGLLFMGQFFRLLRYGLKFTSMPHALLLQPSYIVVTTA